ncbi:MULTISPECIES: hypothetical protein [unclassified Bartonella]
MGSGALGKGGRWQEGWVWICLGECGSALESVVHAGVLLGCVCWGACGGLLRGENAFVMRAKWVMLSRFAV